MLASLRSVEGGATSARIVQQRLDHVATRTVALLEAAADLAGVIRALRHAGQAGRAG